LSEELRDATNLRHHVRLPAAVTSEMADRFAALLADQDRRVLVAVGSVAERPVAERPVAERPAAERPAAGRPAGSAEGSAGEADGRDAAGAEGRSGEAGEEVLGMAVMEPDVLALLIEHRVAHLSHLLVAARHRRRGAGRALLAAAVGYADERGYDQVVVGVSPHSRDANRFYARLGFVPVVTHRLASVAVLRRSLGLPEAVAEARMRPAGRRLRLARSPQRALDRIRAGRDSRAGRDLV
jgi:ribosomal protein S18 acetylase RimI-like enzyme